MEGGFGLGASSPSCRWRQLGMFAPAMTRVPLAPGPKGGQSSSRRRRPATCEACCARGSITACGASDWWLHLKWGQRQASEWVAIVADGHHSGLRRCPRLTAGVHLVIVQLLVVVRLLGVLAACQVQLADRGRAVAGGAGGVQGGGIPPWQCTPLPLRNRRPITTAPHQRELACPERAPALSLLPCE